MFDIITIGSATRDVFLESQDFRDVRSYKFQGGVGECLSLGSKNEVDKIFFTTGGGATNAAVTFARLGLKAACVARVGDDNAGSEIIKVLREEGVDIRFIQKDPDDNTAYSTLLMHGPGERTILVYRGASMKLGFGPKSLNFDILSRSRWFYITSLGGRLDLIRQIWLFARQQKIKIAWNPGGEELRLGLKKLQPFIKQCRVFNVNREEAVRLTNCEWQDKACFTGNLCNLAQTVLITDGKRGAYCFYNEPELQRTLQSRRFGRDEGRRFGFMELFVPSLGTKALNTTGAGDAFGSGFVAGVEIGSRQKRDPISVIRFALGLAILNADSVIREMGAKTGILKKLPVKKEFAKVKITSLKS